MLQEKSLPRALEGTGTFVDFSGVWTNEFQSKMTISQKNDVLSGSYESAVSEGGQKTTGTLHGYADGKLIAFVVHWKDFQAITAWVGQLDPKDPTYLSTLWQMTKRVAPGDEWASINAGADYFIKQ
jgi:hypothetical protein